MQATIPNATNQEDLLSDFVHLAYENRAQEMESRGLTPTGIPRISAAVQAAIRAVPEIQRMIAWWRTNVRPLIEDLRTRDADMDGDVRSLLRQLES